MVFPMVVLSPLLSSCASFSLHDLIHSHVCNSSFSWRKKEPSLKLPSLAGFWFEAAHRLWWEISQIVNQLHEWAWRCCKSFHLFLVPQAHFVSLCLYPFHQCLLHSSLSTAQHPLFNHCFHLLVTWTSNDLSLSYPNFLQSSSFNFQC